MLSKKYLYGIFGARASYRWEPQPLLPVTGHAPDAATTDALLAMVSGPDPDFVLTNLGDVDRVGHSDLSGATLRVARKAALAGTDMQVGRFIDHLKSASKWDSSVVMVLADHSTDWSIPSNVISINLILQPRPELQSNITLAQNGGADLLYWTGSEPDRPAGLAAVEQLVRAHEGVLSVNKPADLRLDAEAGDLVAYCRAGWRFSDPMWRPARSRATTGTPPRSQLRSSSPAAARWWRRERCPRWLPGPSMSRRPSAGFTG